MPGVWIRRPHHNRFHSRANNGVRACAGAADGRTWFQGHIEDCVLRHWALQTVQAFHFGVRQTCSTMMAAGDDPILRNQNRADGRIRAGVTERYLGLGKRLSHDPFVVIHL